MPMPSVSHGDGKSIDWDYAIQQAADHIAAGDKAMFQDEKEPLDVVLMGYHYTSAAIWVQYAEAWNRRERDQP